MFTIENNYVRGDCLEIMKLLPSHCIDLLIIDPPNLILNKHYSTRKWFRRSFGDLGIVEHFFKTFFKRLERLLKPTSFLYIFCTFASSHFFWYYLYPYTKKTMDVIWDKKVSINGFGWRHQHETIIYAEMPKAPKIKTGDGDILSQLPSPYDCNCPYCKKPLSISFKNGDIIKGRAVKVNKRDHPAEKPEEIIEKIILKSSNEGELVADFFAGNATILKVAKNIIEHILVVNSIRDIIKKV